MSGPIKQPCWLDPQDRSYFPEVSSALDEPNGLLAIGGDLSIERLLLAYQSGIFPWYSEGQPILWWSPNPRCILLPDEMKISRSLAKTLRKQTFTVTIDSAFTQVIRACAAPRAQASGTWITPEMLSAYERMHRYGHAHSVECWYQDKLVGGLYGIAIGRVFFGESMFSNRTDASKVALASLCRQLLRWNIKLIDCQVESPHLFTLGAKTIARNKFVKYLNELCPLDSATANWRLDTDIPASFKQPQS